MSREYPERPIVGVGGVLVEDDRVLLVKRARAPLEGEWSIPGGALEVGELLEDALRREMREETGLAVEPVEVLEVLDRIVYDPDGRARYHYVLIDYLCRMNGAGQKALAASDAAECRWAAAADLAGFCLRPETLRVVYKGLERAGQRC